MNSENIKKVTNQAIEQLIAALNQGRSETLTQYLAAIGRFHRYSLRNVMLIASQKPTATHVAGFHAWQKLGRFVKKGEKGILILAPIVRRRDENAQQSFEDRHVGGASGLVRAAAPRANHRIHSFCNAGRRHRANRRRFEIKITRGICFSSEWTEFSVLEDEAQFNEMKEPS
jgi:N-terminal domain of anti-restriction factor ArdC